MGGDGPEALRSAVHDILPERAMQMKVNEPGGDKVRAVIKEGDIFDRKILLGRIDARDFLIFNNDNSVLPDAIRKNDISAKSGSWHRELSPYLYNNRLF